MNTVYLCLSDLLDQDVTAFEYFQTLPSEMQHALYSCEIATFDELQFHVDRLKGLGIFD